METRSFQARSVSELLDAAIGLLKRHYRTLLVLSAIAYIPWLIIGLSVPQVAPGQTLTEEQMAEMIPYFGLFAVAFFWSLLVWTAMIVHSGDLYLERSANPFDALRATLRRTPALLWSTIVKWFLINVISTVISIPLIVVMVIVGAVAAGGGLGTGPIVAVIAVAYIAAIVITAVVYARFFFSQTVLVMENLGPWVAIKRSLELTKGHHWRVVKTYMLVYLIVGVVMATAYLVPFGLTSNWAVSTVIGQVLTMTVFPLIPAVTALLYYDLRIRKEGYDLELMAQSLSGGSLPQPTVPEGVRGT